MLFECLACALAQRAPQWWAARLIVAQQSVSWPSTVPSVPQQLLSSGQLWAPSHLGRCKTESEEPTAAASSPSLLSSCRPPTQKPPRGQSDASACSRLAALSPRAGAWALGVLCLQRPCSNTNTPPLSQAGFECCLSPRPSPPQPIKYSWGFKARFGTGPQTHS